MKNYFEYSRDLAAYVNDQLRHSKLDCVLTMTMQRERSGGYSVQTATVSSSDATEQDLAVLSFLPSQVNT